MTYIGALPDAPRRSKVKFVEGQSRCYKQPYRVYGTNGVSQALAGSETMGRNWIIEIWKI